MTLAGWIFMLLSVGSVVVLTFYCYYVVLTRPDTDGRKKRENGNKACCGK